MSRGGKGLSRFIADHMLGRMCRWLRILGFDVEYVSTGISDGEIIEMCRKTDRILLTRDRELSARYGKSVLVESTNIDDQLRQFVAIYSPESGLAFTRCTECNGELQRRSGEELQGLLEPGTLKSYSEFYQCEKCGTVYWKGPHYRNMEKRITGITGQNENTA